MLNQACVAFQAPPQPIRFVDKPWRGSRRTTPALAVWVAHLPDEGHEGQRNRYDRSIFLHCEENEIGANNLWKDPASRSLPTGGMGCPVNGGENFGAGSRHRTHVRKSGERGLYKSLYRRLGIVRPQGGFHDHSRGIPHGTPHDQPFFTGARHQHGPNPIVDLGAVSFMDTPRDRAPPTLIGRPSDGGRKEAVYAMIYADGSRKQPVEQLFTGYFKVVGHHRRG